jgi:hypothetical protein
MTQLILYSTDDGKSQIQLRADLGTAAAGKETLTVQTLDKDQNQRRKHHG